jgi:predicted AlkP superfamily pyrophosphatase or phosphodiesterase
VHGREGKVFFRRVRDARAYRYEVVKLEGRSPLENQDPRALPDRASELAAGSNPLATDYRKQDPGYSGPGDPRVAFLDADKVSYPIAYERIAAVFDGEHVGHLIVEFTPWGWYPLGEHDGLPSPGAHGQLNVIGSRGPLIFAGRGARKGVEVDGWARSVDIAPTAAKALGVKKRFGVDESGRPSNEVYLRWQDGHVLEEALDGETPARVVILVNDALTSSELFHQLASARPLPSYRWLVANGARFRYGAIVNFPSNTFASHNTIGSGAWSGHHGLIDNWFIDRRTRQRHDPLTQVFNTSKFLSKEVETLHQAIHRSFKGWDPETDPLGNFTMSINDPSTKGADHALLEGIHPVDWSKCPEPVLALPPVDLGISARSQAADNLAVTTFVKGFVGTHDVDGQTVRCAQLPRYVIVNLALTDDVSHEQGPHSPAMDRAVAQTDARQQLLFDAMKQAGAFDDTLFVFTSDHGQCLQDVQRGQDLKLALEKAGIRFRATNAFIYLLTFHVEVAPATLAPGRETSVEVVVRDDDTRDPVAGASVTLESGGATASATTDGRGRASLSFRPAAERTTLTVRDSPQTPAEDRRNDFVKTL